MKLLHQSWPLPHGFFSRYDGVSKAPYDSLNCGVHTGDHPDHIQENIRRVWQDISPDANLCLLHQTHSTNIICLSQQMITQPLQFFHGDALITKTNKLILGIVTADCAPILFYDQKAKIIGAVHAGWKGALHDIIEKQVNAICAMGGNQEDIEAVIGPSISSEIYQIGEDFYQNFLSIDDDYQMFFTKKADGLYFDLRAFCAAKLQKAGIKHIAHLKGEADQYFSHRRDAGVTGRQMSLIMLP